jgi:hypothetical protein
MNEYRGAKYSLGIYVSQTGSMPVGCTTIRFWRRNKILGVFYGSTRLALQRACYRVEQRKYDDTSCYFCLVLKDTL